MDKSTICMSVKSSAMYFQYYTLVLVAINRKNFWLIFYLVESQKDGESLVFNGWGSKSKS